MVLLYSFFDYRNGNGSTLNTSGKVCGAFIASAKPSVIVDYHNDNVMNIKAKISFNDFAFQGSPLRSDKKRIIVTINKLNGQIDNATNVFLTIIGSFPRQREDR